MKIEIHCPYCSNYWDEHIAQSLGEIGRRVVTCHKTRHGEACQKEFVLSVDTRPIVKTYSMTEVPEEEVN